MNTQIDWRGELDSSFGDGTDRPPADYLVPARAALRRRRTAMGAAALATVIVVGGLGWAFAPGDHDTRGSQVASDGPSPVPADNGKAERRQKKRDAAAREAEKPDFLGNPATYDNDGKLVMAPGWTATETIENPMGYLKPGWTSVGLRAVRDGEESFVLIARSTDESGDATSIFANDAVGSLAAWLEGAVASQRTLDAGSSSDGKLVTADEQPVVMTPRGEFHVFGGVQIVESRTGDELPAPLRALGDTVVAAQVTAADGSTEWALGWVADDQPDETISTAEFADLDAFIAWAAQRHASGEGLR